ncbi:glycoside hydrolase superfamily [Desarmillaria tabescens]|uniref:Glycoside hydrolase superfamily n=1 Tax=Armillaria tabescens TaxID=1929756 RepID=A0AA39NM36_ARMTA|nr:glycoside hydrolase superfamily [Desarmillaria tabescens]KAK0468168.1 glycoside hydrolase superfamily [Desarmillaria tabescens]
MTRTRIPLRISFLLLAFGLVRVWTAPLPSDPTSADVYEHADTGVALPRSFPGSGAMMSKVAKRQVPEANDPAAATTPSSTGAGATSGVLTAVGDSTFNSIPTSTSAAGAPSATGAEPEASGVASGNSQDPSASGGDEIDGNDDTGAGDDSTVGDDEPASNELPASDSNTANGDGTSGEESSTGHTGSTQGPLAMGYFPDWAGVTPEQLDFKLFDWIDFAFAIPSSSGSVGFEDESSETKLLGDLVKAAHVANTKVKLSVGGWTGSKDFSKIVSSGQGRRSLAKSILSLYKKYDLDGIDIDWEYPGQAGESSAFQKDDSANFLAFLQLLRKSLPSGAKISAAVQPTTFVGDDGQPMKDVSKFAKVLDWVTIMNYDVSLSSSTPGPNAPLGSCPSAKRPDANAKGGLKAWTSAGFPANQIVLGIASYGYISKSTAKELVIRNDRPDKRQETPGAAGTGTSASAGVPTSIPSSTGAAAPDSGATSTTAYSAAPSVSTDGGGEGVASQDTPPTTDGGDNATDPTDGGADNTASSDEGPDDTVDKGNSGTGDSDKAGTGGGAGLTPDQGGKNMIMFKSIIKQGALTSDYKGAKGFTRLWDKCSSTPFLRSETAGQVVSYDDPQSIMLKGQFVKKSGMLGTNMWDMNGDTKDSALMNAARKGMGISSKSSSSSSQTSGGASKGTGGDITSETDGETNVNDGLVEQDPDVGGDSTMDSSPGDPPIANQTPAAASSSPTASQSPAVNGGDASASATNSQSTSVGGVKRRRRRIYSSSE